MPHVKKAISMPKQLFKELSTLAKQLKVPRSRVVTLAVKEFVEKHYNLQLLKQLNEAYADNLTKEDEEYLNRMHLLYREVLDKW